MKTISQKPYHLCFEVFANKLRLDIVKELQEKEMCVKDLAKKLGVERSRVSHAIKLLTVSEFVLFRREGKKNIYFLNPRAKSLLENSSILTAFGKYIEKYCKRCKRYEKNLS